MIDTVKLWLPAEYCISINLMTEIPPILTDRKQTIRYRDNKIFIGGKLDSLDVLVSNNGIRIKGSLNRYYFGDNQRTLTFEEIGFAFDKIEKALSIPIKRARAQRLDIAENFIVDYPVRNYYPYLGHLSHHNRLEMDNGIYYNGSNQTLLMYDKCRERTAKRHAVLDCYVDKNVFRYELRFVKRYAKLFNKKYVLVSDLLDREFFSSIIERYKNMFDKIYKHKSIVHYSELQINDRAGFWNQVKLHGIKAMGGEAVLLDTVRQARKDKAFKNSMHATRIIQDVKNAYATEFVESHSLVNELEQKITETLISVFLS